MSPAVDLVRLMAMVPQSGGGCAVCAHGGDMSSRRWQQSWPRCNTTAPQGARRRPGRGEGARDEVHGAAPGEAPLPPSLLSTQAASTVHFRLDDDGDVLAAPAATSRRGAATTGEVPVHALSLFPAPVVEYISPVPAVISSLVPMVESVAPVSAVVFSYSPVVESIAPASAVSESPAPVEEFSPAPARLLPVPVVENIAPAPAVSESPAPVVQHIPPVPTVCHTSAPVMEYSSPLPAVFHAPTDIQLVLELSGHEEAEVPRVTLEIWKDGSLRSRIGTSSRLRRWRTKT